MQRADDGIAIALIERAALEQLAAYDDELGMQPRKIIADQIAREAWRRLSRDYRITPRGPTRGPDLCE